MDGIRTPQDLYRQIGTAAAPLVIDVRRSDAFDADDGLIVGAVRRLPEDVERWRRDLPPDRDVVVYCAKGQEVGPDTAAALAAAGIRAAYLEGGVARWRELGLPTRRRIGAAPSRWVTRERPKVDRIACPWLVRRFIDPEAEFIYVPSEAVRDTAARLGGTPYDIPGVEFGHVGAFCSFDAFIRIYGIAAPALDRLALVVRGADTGRPELTPQSPGLLALSQGLSANFADDHEMLAHGMVVYDALYAWCRAQQA
ncbi:MAG TPA: chromate resistance protein ChrB domain-containing protein [Stellaceae bacterium]